MAKKVSQETFDDAVKTNIEDFDMDSEEALKAAVEEFELQGYDLTGIIKSSSGSNVEKHAVVISTEALRTALSSKADQPSSILEALQSLGPLFVPSNADALQENLAISVKAGTVGVLVDCIIQVPTSAAATAANVLTSILQTNDTREALTAADGAARLVSLLKSHEPSDSDFQASILSAAAAASQKDEDNKSSFMDNGLGDHVLALLQLPDVSDKVVVAACDFLKAATNADDERAQGSKAFMHARKLGKSKSMAVFAGLLSRFNEGSSDVCCAVLAALHRLAANEEICKEFVDIGGLTSTLETLRKGIHNKILATACCTALRQLTNSDGSKKAIVEGGHLELIISLLSEYISVPDVLEPALGLLANVTLRNPEASEKAAQQGAMEVLVDILGTSKDSAVARQVCLVTRNMVVRNPDLRPEFISKGVEPLLRNAKKAYPGPCKDVASAALRDLGFDNYNE